MGAKSTDWIPAKMPMLKIGGKKETASNQKEATEHGKGLRKGG